MRFGKEAGKYLVILISVLKIVGKTPTSFLTEGVYLGAVCL